MLPATLDGLKTEKYSHEVADLDSLIKWGNLAISNGFFNGQ